MFEVSLRDVAISAKVCKGSAMPTPSEIADLMMKAASVPHWVVASTGDSLHERLVL